jgi:triphosphatase
MLGNRALKGGRDHSPPTAATSRPAKWRGAALTKKATVSELCFSNVRALLAQLRANQPGALQGDDPEFLHQMRVTVRRLRAMLTLYRGLPEKRQRKSVQRGLKWLAGALGPARDSDVFLREIWPPLRATLDINPWIGRLDEQWIAQRRYHAQYARCVLMSRRYQRLMHRLELWIAAQPVRDGADGKRVADWGQSAQAFARQALQRRAARVRGYDRVLDGRDANVLHRLRIAIKKLRYLMDAFSPLFAPARVRTMRTLLSHLQDVLGHLNDLAVAEQKIDEALPHGKRSDAVRLRKQVAAWRVLHTRELRRKLKVVWREYRHAKTFW